MPGLALSKVFSQMLRYFWHGGLLRIEQLNQTLWPCACAAGRVVSQQGSLHLRTFQAAHVDQMVMHQVNQLFMRKLMGFARRLPQPVTEVQEVIER